MKIILTDDVVGVGDIGQEVKVKAGFARNYLIPRGLALESGSVGAKEAEHRMRQIEAKKKRMKVAAEAEADKLAQASVVVELRVGSGGKVFGSVGTRDIAQKLAAQGFDVDRRRVLLGDPIRKIGTQSVRVKLHSEVIVEVPVKVNAIAASKEQEAEETEEARQAIEEKSLGAEDMPEATADSEKVEEVEPFVEEVEPVVEEVEPVEEEPS